MNLISELLFSQVEASLSGDSAIIQFAAWLAQNALNLMLQSTALILVGLIAARLLGRQGSAVQSAIYRATLVAVLICPFVAVGMSLVGFSGWTIELPGTAEVVAVQVPSTVVATDVEIDRPASTGLEAAFLGSMLTDAAELDREVGVRIDQGEFQTEFESESRSLEIESIGQSGLLPSSSSPNSAAATPAFQSVEKQVSNVTSIFVYCMIAIVWVSVSVFLMIRMLVAFAQLRRLRTCSPAACPEVVAICGEIADRIQVRIPDVRRNSLLSSPCLAGITAPTILLPVELEDQVPLEKAFAHELAHLRRNDTLWNLIQRIALALFFFQPLLWRLVYRLEATAEEVCDDFVVRHCFDRTGYAQQLVELAELNLVPHSLAGVGMFKSKTMLGRRVARILDTTRMLTTQVSGPMVGAIGLLAMSAAMLGGLIGNGSLGNGSLGNGSLGDDVIGSPIIDARGVVAEQDSHEESLVKVSGKILDPNGNPVAGAEIKIMASINHIYSNRGLEGPYATVESGSDGFFKAEFPHSKLLISGRHESRDRNFTLVVRKAGFGLAWKSGEDLLSLENTEFEFKPTVIKLLASKTSIRLRIIDTEGNAVPDASVRVMSVSTFLNDDLSPVIKAAKAKLHLRAGAVPFFGPSLTYSGLPAKKANEKGEVTLEDLGDNRLVALEITGSTICSTVRSHMTLDTESISFEYGGMVSDKTIYHGSNQTVTCESTQPIIGRVVDAVTHEPLAGVKVFSSKFAGGTVSGINRLQTTTDDKGNFRLMGMPKGPGNVIAAVPNDQQPYFMMRHVVPAGVGYEPVETEIRLAKGSWIRGKATDKKTGRPIVGARLFYLPFLSNELAAKSGVYGDNQFMEIQHRYTTSSDGSFQLVGLPGKAVVGLLEIDGKYPAGVGLETIDKEEMTENGSAKTHNRPIVPFKQWPTIMQQVVIAEDSKEFTIDFELNSGMSLPIKVVSEDGSPLSGVQVEKLRSSSDRYHKTKDSLVRADSFKPKEKRLIQFHDKKKNIGRVIELDSSKFAELEKTGPFEVKLSPFSTVRGRLVNSDGDPIEGGKIRFLVGGGGNFGLELDEITSDKNGEFVHRSVCSGTYYSVVVELPNDIKSVADRIEVPVSEQIDLGTINIDDKENRPEPKRKPLKAQAAEGHDLNASETTSQAIVKGKVVAPDGRPLADARVVVMKSEWKSDFGQVGIVLARGKSDAKGNYELEFASQKKHSDNAYNINNDMCVVAAFHPDFGPSWLGIDVSKDQSQRDIELVESEEFAYQILDMDGQPVANAKVEIHALSNRATSTDLFLTNLSEAPKPVTDKDGWFRISGLGENRSLRAWVSGDGIATQYVSLILLSPDDYWKKIGEEYGAEYSKEEMLSDLNFLGGSKLICPPSMDVFGVIRDSETGKPVSGAVVQTTKVFNRWLRSVSDEDGKYKVTGMQMTNRLNFQVHPSDDEPYLKRGFSVGGVETKQSHEYDIELHRGIWIEGRITEKGTGKPVDKAVVSHFPLKDNPNLERYPEYDGQFRMPIINKHYFSDSDGRFRMVGIKGPAVFAVRSFGYAFAGDSLSKFDGKLVGMNATGFGNDMNAGQQVDFQAEFNKIDLTVIEGLKINISTIGPDGKPQGELNVSRLNSSYHGSSYMKGHKLVAQNFAVGEKRLMKFKGQVEKVGLVKEITPGKTGETKSVTVKLQPFGTVKFKLVDGNGKPVDGAARFMLPDGSQLDPRPVRIAANGQIVSPVHSTNGQFSYDSVLAGTTYKMVFSSRQYPAGKVIRESVTIQPGQTTDLGTIDLTDPMASEKVSAVVPPAQDPMVEFSGTVVDSDGQKVGGVIISCGVHHKTTSNSSGGFRFEVPKSAVNQNPVVEQLFKTNKTGYGVTYSRVEFGKHENITLTIDKATPVVGKLIDTEGNPVSGATISVERTIGYGKGVLGLLVESAAKSDQPVSLPSAGRIVMPETQPVVSKEDGTFTLEGLGDDRVAHLNILGEKVALQKAVLITSITDVKNIEAHWGTLNSDRLNVVGNRPTFICEPSQPIEGVAIDRETRQPLPNIEVSSYSFAGTDPRMVLSGQRHLKTTTDKEGKFRLTGMPQSIGNQIMAVAKLHESDEPYVAQVFEVPAAKGIDAIQMELKMDKGVWIQGQVTDEETGKPLKNVRMAYYPARDNDSTLTPFELPTGMSGLLTDVDPRTDADGKYKLMGLPGQGVVTALVYASNDYPHSQGWKAIDTSIRNRVGVRADFITAAKSIEPDSDLQVDFRITKGRKVQIKTVDEAGAPVKDVNVTYLPRWTVKEVFARNSEFELDGFLPGVVKTLLMQSDKLKLGAIVKISAEKAGPVKVILKQNGTLKADFVDGEGKPVSGVRFSAALLGEGRRLWQANHLTSSNESGEFSASLVAGTYQISFQSPKTGVFSGFKNVELTSGQTLDLGQIDTTKQFETRLLMNPRSLNAPTPKPPKKSGPGQGKKPVLNGG